MVLSSVKADRVKSSLFNFVLALWQEIVVYFIFVFHTISITQRLCNASQDLKPGRPRNTASPGGVITQVLNPPAFTASMNAVCAPAEKENVRAERSFAVVTLYI